MLLELEPSFTVSFAIEHFKRRGGVVAVILVVMMLVIRAKFAVERVQLGVLVNGLTGPDAGRFLELVESVAVFEIRRQGSMIIDESHAGG